MNNPNSKNEFKINKYVTLRIIEKEVHIYVGGQEFRQCKGYKTVPNQNVGEVSIEDELWFYLIIPMAIGLTLVSFNENLLINGIY